MTNDREPYDEELTEAARIENEKAFNEAVEQKRMMLELKENPSFQKLMEKLKTQLERRYSALVGFPSNIDKIVQNTYTSGEIAGIKLALEMADTLITYSQAVIDMEKGMRDMEAELNARSEEHTSELQ